MPLVFDTDTEQYGFGSGGPLEEPSSTTGLNNLDWINLDTFSTPQPTPSPPSPQPVKKRRQPRRKAKKNSQPPPEKQILTQLHNKFTIKTNYAKIVGKCKIADKLFLFRTLPVYREDIDYILPGEWLSDSDISLIYELMNELLECHELNEVVQLIWPLVVHLLMYSPMDARELLPKEVGEAQFLFLPFNIVEEALMEANDGDHWALAVYLVLEHCVYVYDLMQDEETGKSAAALANKLSQCKRLVRSHKPIGVKVMSCHQQENFDDCGVHVVMNLALLILRLIAAKLGAQMEWGVEQTVVDGLQGRGDMMELVMRLKDKLE